MKPIGIQVPLPDQRSCRGAASTPDHQHTGRRMRNGFGSLLMWYFLAVLFHACSGQNAPGTGATVAGDTVSGLSEAIMVVYQDQKNNYWFGSRAPETCGW